MTLGASPYATLSRITSFCSFKARLAIIGLSFVCWVPVPQLASMAVA